MYVCCNYSFSSPFNSSLLLNPPPPPLLFTSIPFPSTFGAELGGAVGLVVAEKVAPVDEGVEVSGELAETASGFLLDAEADVEARGV